MQLTGQNGCCRRRLVRHRFFDRRTGEGRRRRGDRRLAQCRAPESGGRQARRQGHRRRRHQRRQRRQTVSAPAARSIMSSSPRRSCAPGRSRPSSMDDVRSTMEGKFWGAWRVARAADIRTGRIAHAGVRFPEHPAAAQCGDRRVGQRRDRVADARAGRRSLAGARQLRLARSDRHADPRRHAGGRAPEMLAKTAAALPVGRVGVGEDIARQILAFMTNRLCHRFGRLYRRRRPGDLTRARRAFLCKRGPQRLLCP